MPNVLNLDLINQLCGKYSREERETILTRFRNACTLASIFPVYTMVKDEVMVTSANVSSVMQPYQKGWTPKGAIELIPEILKVRYAKADNTLDPNEIRGTHYAKFLTTAKSEEHEIVRFAYEQFTESAAHDSDRALIQAKYKLPATGVAGEAMDTCDGYLEFLTKCLSAGKIIPTETGAITEENIIAKVNAIYEDIPEDMRDGKIICYMSKSLRQMYFRAYRNEFGSMNNYEGWDGSIDGTEVKIQELPYMGKSQRITFTFEGNFRRLTLNDSDAMSFETQKTRREIDFLMDWALGFGAMIVGKVGGTKSDQYIWCNDVDMPSLPTE